MRTKKTRPEDALVRIERRARAQRELIDTLLEASQLTTGRVALASAPVEIGHVVRGATERVAGRARERGVVVIATPAAGPAVVEGDAARLHSVFTALLENAVASTSRGGRVLVTVERRAGSVCVRVTDDGAGIAPAALPYVFEDASVGASAVARGGGLGLYVVKELVHLHHGRVDVSSEGHDKGASFAVTLPALPPSADAAVLAPRTVRRASTNDALRGMSVLVVEDDDDTRTILGEALALYGAKVAAASDGVLALRALDNFAPEVVVSDILLPGMDGWTLLPRLRARRPVSVAVAVSGLVTADDARRSRAAGFDDHLGKPVRIERLVHVLGEVLQGAADRLPRGA